MDESTSSDARNLYVSSMLLLQANYHPDAETGLRYYLHIPVGGGTVFGYSLQTAEVFDTV